MKKTNRRLSSFLLLLLAAMALLAFGVFTNVLTDIWGHNIKAAFKNNPVLIAAFALLLGVVGYLYTKIENRNEKPAPEAVDKDQYDEAFVQFRKNLLEQYQTRLASKTGRRLPVNLTAKSTHFGTASDRVRAYFKDKELTIESDDIASEIDKILKGNARLLLIGEPGAGKTTILLYAAINILNTSYSSDDLKSSDELQKLPLILNLATWTQGRDFAEWYAQNVAHSYSLSPVFVQELLRRNAVVPFFDGFDEVAEEHRDDCFQKMAAYFGDEKRKQLIVSSRKKEYAAAQADAPVYAEIEVLPLSLAQIKKALSENAESQAADRALLHALEHDRWLAEAVETPFYLNTASFLFGKGQRTLADFPFQADSTDGRQAELVEIFVAEQVPEERGRKYLSFLAGKMSNWYFPVFELAAMQPWWCTDFWQYRLAVCSAYGLIGGLIFCLVFGWIYGLIAGLLVGVIAGLPTFRIQTADLQTWSWRSVIKNWKQNLDIDIGGSLIASILICSVAGWNNWILGLVGGFTFGLVNVVRDAGIITRFQLYIHSPYHRFWATYRNSFTAILPIIMVLFSIIVGEFVLGKGYVWEELKGGITNPNTQLNYAKFILFLFLLPLLYPKFLEHFSLRLVLYLEGKMPLRVVTFLDRMTDQLIFEDNRRKDKKGRKRRGATWRFRHKILQDYFAKPQ